MFVFPWLQVRCFTITPSNEEKHVSFQHILLIDISFQLILNGLVVWIPGIPENERNCYLMVPRFESQTINPPINHLLIFELPKWALLPLAHQPWVPSCFLIGRQLLSPKLQKSLVSFIQRGPTFERVGGPQTKMTVNQGCGNIKLPYSQKKRLDIA